jgi:hypothetical protein
MADIESNVRRGRWIPLGPFTPRLQYTAETAQLTHAWLIGILRAFALLARAIAVTERTIETRGSRNGF